MKGIVDEASGTPGGLERYRTPAMVNATMQQSLYKRELAPIKAAEKKRKEAEYRKNNPSVSVPSIQIGASNYPIHVIHNWIGSKDLNAAVEFAVNKFAYRQSKDFKTEIAGDPDFQKAVKNFFNVAEKSLNHRDSTRTKSHWDGKIRAAPRETDTSSDGFDAINKINDALLPYYKKYGVDKTGRRVPPNFNYALGEAKAKQYVKPYNDPQTGEQIGWVSSDGYHKKYWQKFAKAKAYQHAKLNPDEVDEGIRDNIKKAALGLGTAAALVASPVAAQTSTAAPSTQMTQSSFEKVAGEKVTPGQPLSAVQMATVNMGKQMGKQYSKTVLDAYQIAVKQGVKPFVGKVTRHANGSNAISPSTKSINFENYTGEFAAEKTPAINPYGGLKDNQFRGAISEEPTTSGPVGTQPGGWRKYKPKPAGELDESRMHQYDINDALKKVEDYYRSQDYPSRGAATRLLNVLYQWKNTEDDNIVTRAQLLRTPNMGKQAMALLDNLLGNISKDESPYDQNRNQAIVILDSLKQALASDDMQSILDLMRELKNSIGNMDRLSYKRVREDTAYAGGMGQGGNAGESYRKFKPKSAGTFNEDELDEACWKGYHKEGNKKMFGKTYPNCVKNTNEEKRLDKNKISEYNVDDMLEKVQDCLIQSRGQPKRTLLTKLYNIVYHLRRDHHGNTISREELKLTPWLGKHGLALLDTIMDNTSKEEQLDEKCWDTHKQVGMKTKGGKSVPNCVPKESAIMKGINRLT